MKGCRSLCVGDVLLRTSAMQRWSTDSGGELLRHLATASSRLVADLRYFVASDGTRLIVLKKSVSINDWCNAHMTTAQIDLQQAIRMLAGVRGP
jgi:hypothetical protein